MATALLTADTSVVLPFLMDWHPMHAEVRTSAVEVSTLPGHVLLETVSTMTRLPGGFAVSARSAAQAVLAAFPGSPMVIGTRDYTALVGVLEKGQITGGAVYDALVAMTAKVAGARLLSLDRRAERTYRAIGVDYRLLD